MSLKSIFVVFALTLTTAGFALADSIFSLASPAMLGARKLKAGQYEVKIKKDQAVFTDPDGKTFSMPVKVEESATKFDITVASTSSKAGVDLVTEIDLGGSKTKLMFAQ
jgi:hypothetical protein